MKIIYLVIGTVLAVLFILQLARGKSYEYLLENLDGSVFPLCSLYGVGFVWSQGKLLSLRGSVASSLKVQASLLYEPQYAEYYANVVWAQMLTLVHLFLSCTFLLAGLIYSNAVLILAVGIFMAVFMVVYSMQDMKNKVAERTAACEQELPEVVSTMAILVNSGMVLREVWSMIGENGKGVFYDLMRKASDDMRNGHSDADAIFLFGKASNSAEIKKFTSALIQSLERGGGELGTFLANQSSELWNTKRQKMLQSGEKAATKLLLPIMLIFLGIILIVITAAFAGALF